MIGCGPNVKFGGKVTYSDDGSPLAVGMVCFESDSFLARGELNKDGYYDLGSQNLKDGIPKGVYRVYISGAEDVEDIAAQGDGQADYATYVMSSASMAGTMGGKIFSPLIDPKFTSGNTSGLTVNIDGTSKTFDFQVDRYQPHQ